MPVVTYDTLSKEYYREDLHPTSNNFRSASKKLITKYLHQCRYSDKKVGIETGAGNSILAEWLVEQKLPLDNLNITDLHQSMLDYSRPYESKGAKLAVCAAEEISNQYSNIDIVVSSLGDPYNTIAFWRAIHATLQTKGYCIFTTPSFEWANQFRYISQSNDEEHAHFITQDGLEVRVPSFIYSNDNQVKLSNSAGLIFVQSDNIYLHELKSKISPKLLLDTSQNYPILTGYLFQKID